jgi:hypothetical protein
VPLPFFNEYFPRFQCSDLIDGPNLLKSPAIGRMWDNRILGARVLGPRGTTGNSSLSVSANRKPVTQCLTWKEKRNVVAVGGGGGGGGVVRRKTL